MDRLTGTGALELKEAYNAIYANQEEVEITEEQIQEEFETWVYSLVEEGHDLSEYTWDEMYEHYLNEMGQRITTGQATAPVSNAPYRSRFARPMNAGTPQQTGRGTAVSRPQIGGLPANYRGQELQQASRAKASQVGTPRQGSAGTGTAPSTSAPRSVARPATVPSTTTVRSGAPVARPTTSPRPAVTSQPSIAQSYSMRPGAVAAAPRTGTTTTVPQSGSAVQGYQTAVAQRPSLAQQAAELRAMRQKSQQRQGVTPTSNLTQSFDPFDVVLEYLVAEGYADTNEDALVIMANMHEEWRQSIIEECLKKDA
jgi:hypothetical protein